MNTTETLLERLINVPDELTCFMSWVLWRAEHRGGKPTKIPYNANNPANNARANDGSTWATFERAVNVFASALDTASPFCGIGYMFSKDDPYIGVDFDDCVVGDAILPDVLHAIERFGGYAEISPSLTGVKLWTRAEILIPEERTGFTRPGMFGCSRVEVYKHGRYFTVTGREVTR